MRHYYKISKIRNSKGIKVEYLQVWKGEAKGKGSLIQQIGTADKLLKKLVRANQFELMTKKYPQIVTKFLEGNSLVKD